MKTTRSDSDNKNRNDAQVQNDHHAVLRLIFREDDDKDDAISANTNRTTTWIQPNHDEKQKGDHCISINNNRDELGKLSADDGPDLEAQCDDDVYATACVGTGAPAATQKQNDHLATKKGPSPQDIFGAKPEEKEEEEEEECEEPVVSEPHLDIQPPALERGNILLSLPGAFVDGPGEQLLRLVKVSYSQVGRAPLTMSPLPPPPPPTSSAQDVEQQHPVANLVTDDTCHSHLQSAKELDPSSSKGRSTKPFRLGLIGMGVVSIIVMVALLKLVLPKSNKDNTNDTFSNNNQSTPITTAAPTLSLEEHVLSLLPDYTLEEISNDPASPQAGAYHWILNDTLLVASYHGHHLDFHYDNSRILQRFALATLYYSTNGDKWANNTGWLSYDHHECDWYSNGYFHQPYAYNLTSTTPCNDDDDDDSNTGGEYKHLLLYNNRLGGTIPPELYLLTSLHSLDVAFNNIGGSISSHIAKLTSLKALEMSTCDFTGTLPSEVGLFGNLTATFAVGGNDLDGTLPSELGRLTSLANLDLFLNLFTGRIPHQIWSMDNLVKLNLFGNDFDNWSLPPEVAQLKSLEYLGLSESHLTGPIPTELGLVKSLWGLFLWHNDLTGSVPSEIGHLSLLKFLMVGFNHLTGLIPTEVFQATKLDALQFAHNKLVGSIPSELGLFNSLCILDVSGNQLTGSLPTELGKLTNLGSIINDKADQIPGWVDFSGNMISGTIPTEMANLQNLGYQKPPPSVYFDTNFRAPSRLGLSNNMLSGSIPRCFVHKLSNLEILDVSGNHLSGLFPSEFGQWSRLISLNIADNPLMNGTIPDGFGSLALNGTLTTLDLTNTAISGMLPSGLCSLQEKEDSSSFLGFNCSLELCGCNCRCVEASNLNNNGRGALVGEFP